MNSRRYMIYQRDTYKWIATEEELLQRSNGTQEWHLTGVVHVHDSLEECLYTCVSFARGGSVQLNIFPLGPLPALVYVPPVLTAPTYGVSQP